MAGAGNPNGVQPAGQDMAGPATQMGGGQNVYGQSAGALTGAMGGVSDAMMGPQIGRFMNPFTSAVTNRTMGDLERQRQMQMNNIGASATAAGAFGGSRHGVAEALTNEGFARQGADTFANLNMQGYNNALGAGQTQQQMQLSGAGTLGNLAQTGFGFGEAINDRQMQQGTMQQGVMQALIDAARGQYGGFTSAPQDAVSLPLAAVGGANMGQQSQTTTQQPGLMNYLSLGLGLL